MAPPSRLTGAVEHELATLIATGIPLSTAARSLGLPPRTVRDWLHLGQQPDAPEHWAKFAQSIEEARDENRAAVELRLEQLRGRLD